MTVMTASTSREGGMTSEERMVIFASSLGTVFEWYDFYIYGTLAPILAAQFFSGVNPTAAFIFTLLAFAAGFAVRPFGALFFGRLGDIIGRKYTFLITMSLMGVGTFFIGVLPSYAKAGIIAPVILICLRLAQGLALGGEYGGAAIYVAEHAPKNKRGLYTSWIQTTATLGLFMALLLVLGIRIKPGRTDLRRLGLAHSVPAVGHPAGGLGLDPAQAQRVALVPAHEGTRQRLQAAVDRSLRQLDERQDRDLRVVRRHRRRGGGVVRRTVLCAVLPAADAKVPAIQAQIMIAVSLLLGTPFFIVFGWLSDKIGRKPIILAGFALAVVTYFPIFQGLVHFTNPKLEAALASAPVTVIADPNECSFQFNPVGTAKFTTSCDIAKSALVTRSVNYQNEVAPAGTKASVRSAIRRSPRQRRISPSSSVTRSPSTAIRPAPIWPTSTTSMTVILLTILVIYVTMVYAPIAAWLVELFPTRIRYSGLSLPYHIGNGWFGGFLPATVFAIVAATGNIYSGLWYPIVVAAMSFVVGLIFLPETKDRDITVL